ncbi:MAG: S8 family serine peptidase [Armatimonadota bacterium]|nr:S8 family serine peptidase [Armatimonadota bacterium]MDR7550798.1 S8 family serine peptidase [Armatimonadota bacterium]
MTSILRRAAVLLTAAALVATSVVSAGAGGRATDTPPVAAAQSDYVIVKLADPPVASYEGGIPGYQRTKPVRGRKLDPSSDAVKKYKEYLAGKRQAYKDYLKGKAPRATVVRELATVFNGVAVKLNGESARVLAAGPGVAAVFPSTLVRPAMNISPGLINAPVLWSELGGARKAGEGIRIGIIDTGIDVTSPFLSEENYPTVKQTDACKDALPHVTLRKPGGKNTSNKVFICRVFFSGVAPGAHVRPEDLMVFDHGTHVAGTAAGNHGTDGTVVGTDVLIRDLSGIAPRALLGDYNVFPGFGAGFVAFGGAAFSHDIAAALEAAVEDGMDVVNMSLGGGVQGPHDLLAEATNATADAGVIAAVAAGNSGPGDATVESPGSAEKALTAGASTNPHFVGIPVTVAGKTFGAALGDFENFGKVTAPYTVTSPANGCTTISTDLTGKIALIDRGACSFTTKIRNAQAKGAIGVLVVNNVAGDPVAMGHDGTSPFPEIPAAMVSKGDGAFMKAQNGGTGTVSIDGTKLQEFITPNADIIAGFSSRGPAPFTYLIKPDATAPGVNVLSSVFHKEFAFFQGTSMATPHLAGSAAVLLQFFRGLFGDRPPLPYSDIVKSAIVTTAKRPVFDHVFGTGATGVLTRGGGRVDLAAAMNAAGAFAPASVSFGFHRGSTPISVSRTVTVANITKTGQTYNISIDPAVTAPGLSVQSSAGSLPLASGETATFTVSLTAATSVPTGDYEGDIVVTAGSVVQRIPYWVRIDRLGRP